jgi:hypothetical protein
MLSRRKHKVPTHLHSFGINELGVTVDDHTLHEMLMYNFSICPPNVAIIHYEYMVTSSNETVTNVMRRTIAINGRLLVDEILDKASVRKDDHVSRS